MNIIKIAFAAALFAMPISAAQACKCGGKEKCESCCGDKCKDCTKDCCKKDVTVASNAK